MSGSVRIANERLFLALWPDQAVRERLDACRRDLTVSGGRAIAARNLHVTLVFLGAADALRRAGIERACEAVAGKAFELRFDAAEWQRRSGIVWLAASAPLALRHLVSLLNGALADAGHAPEQRLYRPHVTLWRDVRQAERRTDIAPIRWSVRDYCLVSSTLTPTGSEYQVQRRWPLAG